MITVYIAGAVRAKTYWGIAQNINEAEKWAIRIAHLGCVPMCVHSMTRNFHGELDEEKFWIPATQELLLRCDAGVWIPGWERSVGATAELKLAEQNNIPCFVHNGYNDDPLVRLQSWMKEQ